MSEQQLNAQRQSYGAVASQGLMRPSGASNTPAGTPAQAPAGGQPAQGAPAAFNFKAILQQMIQQNASDLHLKVGRPPTLRVQGELIPLQLPAMKPEDLKSLAEQVMTPKQVKEFAEFREADFATGVPGIGRFRVNA